MSPEPIRQVVILGDAFADRVDALQQALGQGYAVTALRPDRSLADREAILNTAFAVIAVQTDATLPIPPSVALLQVPGIGWDGIDLAQISTHTPVANVGGHEPGVAEYCMAQMLEWRHRLGPANAALRAGSWARSSRYGGAAHGELSGATVGIVGYGGIGRALAKRLAAFDVTVLAANRSPIPDPGPAAEIFALADTAEMFARCDFGVVAVALTPDTTGLIAEQALTALGPDGVLLNVARGPVVDEAALWQALRDGRLGGAVLDVWYRYPATATDPDQSPAAHDFAALPNVVMTPHISGWTKGTLARRVAVIAENIRRAAAGQPPQNLIAHGSRP
jgi:phosphoglycerate dehydrogenase-like enzyme